MKTHPLFAAFGFVLLGSGLAGCTSFSPVYGERADFAPQTLSFQFAKPTNRLEQIIYNELLLAFPEPAKSGDPVLTVVASSGGTRGPLSDNIEVGEIRQSRVQATVTIAQGERIFTATRFTDSGMKSGELVITNLTSTVGAQERAARSTADSLRAAILAGYRPGF